MTPPRPEAHLRYLPRSRGLGAVYGWPEVGLRQVFRRDGAGGQHAMTDPKPIDLPMTDTTKLRRLAEDARPLWCVTGNDYLDAFSPTAIIALLTELDALRNVVRLARRGQMLARYGAQSPEKAAEVTPQGRATFDELDRALAAIDDLARLRTEGEKSDD